MPSQFSWFPHQKPFILCDVGVGVCASDVFLYVMIISHAKCGVGVCVLCTVIRATTISWTVVSLTTTPTLSVARRTGKCASGTL